MTGMVKRLRQTLARSKRHRQIKCAFLLLSLNDSSDVDGIVEVLESLTRCEDTVLSLPESRVGVILEDLTHISDPLRVANRLRESRNEEIQSVAVVTGLETFECAEEILGTAKKTLHKAAQEQLPTLYADPDSGTEARDRLQMEAELVVALDSDQLITYYQPIFNLTRGTLTGFEALVRWDHPQRGLMLPGEFLSIAEQRGHLLRIDEIVLKRALTQIPIWNADSGRPIYVSANLASDHFLKADNLTALLETLNAHQDSLNLLRIDVSEQVLFDQSGIDSLNTLDMLRIGFNLDDFGVDSESFHCLGSFPFNSLKVDRTLICQMEDEVNAELIVAVLRIAKRMGMKTIAEGVVTHAQLEELRNLGCTEAQGFLFSEAVDVEKAGEMINDEYRW